MPHMACLRTQHRPGNRAQAPDGEGPPRPQVAAAAADLCAGVPQRGVQLLKLAQEDVVEAQGLGDGQPCRFGGQRMEHSEQ